MNRRTAPLAFLAALSLVALRSDAFPAGEASTAELQESAAAADSPEEPARDSLLLFPAYLTEEPPETRAVRQILVQYAGAVGVSRELKRTREEALEIAAELRAQLDAGTDFAELARTRSDSHTARHGGVLGTFPPQVLAPILDRFLFAAEVGDISEPMVGPRGVQVLQRIERNAACRQIFIKGKDDAARERLRAVVARLAGGADFADVARELSEDPLSAPRGGALAIFERGSGDALVKLAAFEAEVGQIVGPVVSPQGLHLIQRVPLDELDPSLADYHWFRASAILISWGGAPQMPFWVDRSPDGADAFAKELWARLEAGESFEELARMYNDDIGGRERAGDLGWLYRRSPLLPNYLVPLGLGEVGDRAGPIPVSAGWVLVERTR